MLLSILALTTCLMAVPDDKPAPPAPAPQAAAASAEDMDTSFVALKSAEEKKDVEAVMKLAVETSTLARQIIKGPAPDGVDAEAWKARVESAKQIDGYCDYAFYVIATGAAGDPAKFTGIFEAFDKNSPDSHYVKQLYGTYISALARTKKGAQAMQFANKAITKDPNNEDVLLILADSALSAKQWDRASTFGTRLASVMSSKAKPEGIAAGDWDRKKTLALGVGYRAAGVGFAAQGKYPQADKNLKAALPYIKGDARATSEALFYLGVANYQLARVTRDKVLMKQALAYSEQAAALAGPYQQQAAQNVYAIKTELSRP